MPNYDKDFEAWLKNDIKTRRKRDDMNYAIRSSPTNSHYYIRVNEMKKISEVIGHSKYAPIMVMIDGKPHQRSVNLSPERIAKLERDKRSLKIFYRNNPGCFMC
jgi:hypothetical protein